jgi:cell division protein FtsL
MAAIPLLRDLDARRVRTVSPQRRSTSSSPKLAVVRRRRRWPALLAVVASVVVFLGLLGAAVFHTQLAERQLRLDRLDRAVAAERERFDELRYERAELRSPVRLAEAAGALGMRRGDVTEFLDVDPQLLARQIAAAGVIDDRAVRIAIDTDPLDQFRAVKAVTDEVP